MFLDALKQQFAVTNCKRKQAAVLSVILFLYGSKIYGRGCGFPLIGSQAIMICPSSSSVIAWS
jgi:hypothetical protein